MTAKENGATTVFSSRISKDIYNAPKGWKITKIDAPTKTSHTHSYKDSDFSNENVTVRLGEFARRYVFVGDSSGTDNPKVTAYVHPITITIQNID